MNRSYLKRKFSHVKDVAKTFFKWLLVASVTGVVGGLIGWTFSFSVCFAGDFFTQNTWLIWLLPIGGLLIVLLYAGTHMLEFAGTDEIIGSIRTGHYVRFATAPLIFIGTVITHLLGGSAGREGAALQLGGSIGVQIGRLFRLKDHDIRIITLCGMSALFSALFATPLTAVFFAIEVISVGVMYYAALWPCIVASFAAYTISQWLGAESFAIQTTIPTFEWDILWRVAILSALCAGLSVVFCVTMRKTAEFFKKRFQNPFIRIVVGSLALIGLTYLCGSNDYNGTGVHLVLQAVNDGTAVPAAFLWKILFTAVTIACGFKGGEIVPTFFIGSTFGCLAGGLLGLDPAFGAAVGLIAVFCGAINCPVASIVLSVELFGVNGLLYFALACAISYV
ncbi:MAG: chloride channel protein, partial [Clostridia bacterium]|nr:chloride channel protein [Clostridia bacterium]